MIDTQNTKTKFIWTDEIIQHLLKSEKEIEEGEVRDGFEVLKEFKEKYDV